MSNTRLATRYATPILDLANQNGVLEEVKHDMELFKALCNENKELILMLRSPIVSSIKKSEILKKLFTGRFNALTLKAFNIVTRKGREAYLPEIAEVFLKKYNLLKGIQEVTLVTAVPLTDKLRTEFEQLVKKLSNKESLIHEEVDPEVIGGYVLKLGDQQIDESINGQLKELELKFKNETT